MSYKGRQIDEEDDDLENAKSGMVKKPIKGLVWNKRIDYKPPVSSDKHTSNTKGQ